MTVMTRTLQNGDQQSESRQRDVVIAIHGSASTGGQWHRLVGELTPEFEVHTPDLPGYGSQAQLLTTAKPRLEADAVVIERIANGANAPVHLVAHSYGAAVALAFALHRPQAVASLTLIEPALFHLLRSGSVEDMHHFTEINSVNNAVRIANQVGAVERGMARFVDYWSKPGAWDAMKPTLQAALAAQTPQVARNFAAAFSETWSPTICKRIECPTLLVSADESPAPARRVVNILHNAISHSRLATIADAGHMMPITHPNIINPLIAEALAAARIGCNEASLREAA